MASIIEKLKKIIGGNESAKAEANKSKTIASTTASASAPDSGKAGTRV